jgi:rhamnulokinase
MGLWMLQGCRQRWIAQGRTYDYDDLMEMASREPAFTYLVDPDDDSFLHPSDMTAAIADFCKKTQQPAPASPGAFVRCIFESLALKYRLVLRSLEQLTNQRIQQIRSIGGGSKNRMLNQFTTDATGRTVIAGPAEATALGNIVIQVLATGGATSLREVRAMVDRSFPTEVFEPVDTDLWDRQAQRFEHYCEIIYA